MLPTTLFIPLGGGSVWNNNELRYALRSWEKYSNIEEVLIIGHKPDWYKGGHIRFDKPYCKTEDIFLKTQYAASLHNRFIFANDDHVLLQPLTNLPYYYDGLLSDYHDGGSDTFRRYISNTAALYPGGKYFDVHTPMIVEPDIMLSLKYTRDTILKSCYCNEAEVDGVEIKDPILRAHTAYELISPRVESWPCMSWGDGAMTWTLKQWLRDQFPEPSKWEV